MDEKKEIESKLKGITLEEQISELEEMVKAESQAQPELRESAPEQVNAPIEEPAPQAKDEVPPAAKTESAAEEPEWKREIDKMKEELATTKKRFDDTQAWGMRLSNEKTALQRKLDLLQLETEKPERLVDDPELEKVMEFSVKKQQLLNGDNSVDQPEHKELSPEQASFKMALLAAHPDAPDFLESKEFNEFHKPTMDALGGDYLKDPAKVLGEITRFKIERATATAVANAREAARKEYDVLQQQEKRQKEINTMSAPAGGVGRKPAAKDDDMARVAKMTPKEAEDELNRILAGQI